jgi:hypothetical protein
MGALGAAVRPAHTRTVVDPDAQFDIADARTMIEDLVEAADCAMYEAKRTGALNLAAPGVTALSAARDPQSLHAQHTDRPADAGIKVSFANVTGYMRSVAPLFPDLF